MRQAKPYYKTSHRCYYFNHAGKPVRLHEDKEIAWEIWYEYKAGVREVTGNTLVLELISDFLLWVKRNQSRKTYVWYRDYLESFYQSIGTLRLSALKPMHVDNWISQKWPDGAPDPTIRSAMRAVQRVCNWARKSGRIKSSPLADMEKPSVDGRDVYLMPDQFKILLRHIRETDPFHDVVVGLRETGCRPQEIRAIEALHFDKSGRCWVLPRLQAKGKRSQRTILLNDRMFEISERLALKNPQGPIFRNIDGGPWTKDAMVCRCRRLRTKVDFYVCPYAIRHTFATDAIIRGVDLVTIAQLMGHTDLKMLQRIYQHVHRRSDHMQKALAQATRDVA
jgi:integrase